MKLNHERCWTGGVPGPLWKLHCSLPEECLNENHHQLRHNFSDTENSEWCDTRKHDFPKALQNTALQHPKSTIFHLMSDSSQQSDLKTR